MRSASVTAVLALSLPMTAMTAMFFACSVKPLVALPDDDGGVEFVDASMTKDADVRPRLDAAVDAGPPVLDAAADGDARSPVSDAGPYLQTYGDAGAGADCEFNRSCAMGLRCECTAGNCACKAGARGTGRNGIDSCVDGQDCGSSICIQPAVGSYCSDECKTSSDCGPKLPVCKLVFGFTSKICAP
jgi:hypothetical protein